MSVTKNSTQPKNSSTPHVSQVVCHWYISKRRSSCYA